LRSSTIKLLVKPIITVAFFVFIFTHYQVSITTIFSNEFEQPIWIILSLAFAVLLNPVFISNRWKIFLQQTGINESLRNLIKINFISYFYGIVFPTSIGMDIFRVLILEKKYPNRMGHAGSTVLAERLLGFFLLSLLGVAGALLLKNRLDSHPGLIATMLLISTGIFALILVVTNRFALNIVKSLLSKTAQVTNIQFVLRILAYIDNLYHSLCNFPLKQSFLKALPFMLCFQLSNILIGWFIFLSLGIHLSLYVHLALLPLIAILTVLPLSVSGFGIREGAFVYFYSSLQIPPEISILVSLLYFFVITGATAAIGGVIVILSNIRRKHP